RFDKRHLMAALGSDARRFKTGNSATHHENALRALRRREAAAAPSDLAAGTRIDEAGNPVVAIPPAPAHLIAREAGADVLGPAFPPPVGEEGVGDMAPGD